MTSMSRLAQVLCQTELSCLLSPSWCWQTSASLSFLNTKSPKRAWTQTHLSWPPALTTRPPTWFLSWVLGQSCRTPLNCLTAYLLDSAQPWLAFKPHNTRNRKHKQESPAVIHFLIINYYSKCGLWSDLEGAGGALWAIFRHWMYLSGYWASTIITKSDFLCLLSVL